MNAECQFCKSCTLLGYYAASSGNFLPTFQDNHYLLRNNQIGSSSQLLYGGSLKSHKVSYFLHPDAKKLSERTFNNCCQRPIYPPKFQQLL